MKCSKCKKRETTTIHHKDENHKNNKPSNLIKLCDLCHAKIHGISPKKSELRRLVDFRDRAIQLRNALNNQIRSLSRIEYIIPDFWTEQSDNFNEYIKEIEKEIKKLIVPDGKGRDQVKNETQWIFVSPYPIWDWLKEIKGISHNTVAKLIAHIDIENTPTVSALWRYCGLDATHIKRTKKITQEEAKKFGKPYLKKKLLGTLADSFIRQRTPKYRKIYDEEKDRQLKILKEIEEKTTLKMKPNRCLSSPPESLGHAHNRARRKMIKEFIKDLFIHWKKIEEK